MRRASSLSERSQMQAVLIASPTDIPHAAAGKKAASSNAAANDVEENSPVSMPDAAAPDFPRVLQRLMHSSGDVPPTVPRKPPSSGLARPANEKQSKKDSDSATAELSSVASSSVCLAMVTMATSVIGADSTAASKSASEGVCAAQGESRLPSSFPLALPSASLDHSLGEPEGAACEEASRASAAAPDSNVNSDAKPTSNANDAPKAVSENIASAASGLALTAVVAAAASDVPLSSSAPASGALTEMQACEPATSATHPGQPPVLQPPRLSHVVEQVRQLQTDGEACAIPVNARASVRFCAGHQEEVQRAQTKMRSVLEVRSPVDSVSSGRPSQATNTDHQAGKGKTSAADSPTNTHANLDAADCAQNPANDTSSDQEAGSPPGKPREAIAVPKLGGNDSADFARVFEEPSCRNGAADPATGASAVPLPANHTATNANDSVPSQLDSQPSVSSPPHLPEMQAGRIVNAAQFVESNNRSEMRIEFQTDRLGNVQVHTRVAGDEVGAAITVEKRDAHAALAVELPALQQALSTKQLRVQNVILSQGSLASTAGDTGRNPQQQQASSTNHHAHRPSWGVAPKYLSASKLEIPLSGIFDTQGRLNVHA